MLRGQLSTAFLLHMAIGFLLILALTYATISLEDSMKQQNMEQALTPIGEYIGVNVLATIGQIGMGRSINQTLRLPVSGDWTTGQYSVAFQDVDGMWYVAAMSTKWPDTGILQPLYLNSSYVTADSKLQYPPYFCYNITRNTSAEFLPGDNEPKYHIYLNC